jgi:hypothetical protein
VIIEQFSHVVVDFDELKEKERFARKYEGMSQRDRQLVNALNSIGEERRAEI